MKGLIFTEFFEMVSETFSPEMVEEIIEASNLPNDGAYTDIGTYDHEELIRLVTHLSNITNISVPNLEIAYGRYLFQKLLKRYSSLVEETKGLFEFLFCIDNHIHVEVLKLYPEAELPRFECQLISPNKMIMEYQSNHPFADLAEGLILGCAEYFNETILIERERQPPKNGKRNVTLFTLTKE